MLTYKVERVVMAKSAHYLVLSLIAAGFIRKELEVSGSFCKILISKLYAVLKFT